MPTTPITPITTTPTAAISSSVTTSAEDWVTREDMAALMRVHPDTVRRACHKNELDTREDEAGRVLVNIGDFLRIGRLRPEDLTAGATPAESAEVLRARATVTALTAQVAELTGRLAQADLVRDTLREQLAVKDKQLAQQSSQLTQLTQLLGRLTQTGQLGGAA
jgi:hypothetical protein